MSDTPENETVTITRKEYELLQFHSLHLNLLEVRGVDNWDGFGYPPERGDYETDEQYEVAVEEAFEADDF
jgi:hypothetical protein